MERDQKKMFTSLIRKSPWLAVVLSTCAGLFISLSARAQNLNTPSFDERFFDGGSRLFDPHAAAQNLMNVMYQSCQAVQQRPFNLFKQGEMKGYTLVKTDFDHGSVSVMQDLLAALQSSYYLNCSNADENPILNQLCQTPPTYIWGGKGLVQEGIGKYQVNIFANKDDIESIAHHPGIDCSGYVNLSFAMAGLRVVPLQKVETSVNQVNAADFIKPSGCFRTVNLDQGELLLPGDVFAWSTHVVMIDSVGNDPFGLKDIKNPADCQSSRLNPLDFKIVVINSKGGVDPLANDRDLQLVASNPIIKMMVTNAAPYLTGVGIGVSRMKLSQLVVTHPSEIMDLAETVCLAKFNISKKMNNGNVTRHILTESGYGAEDFTKCSLSNEDQVEFLGDDLVCR